MPFKLDGRTYDGVYMLGDAERRNKVITFAATAGTIVVTSAAVSRPCL